MDEKTREIMGLPYNSMVSYWQHYWKHCIDKLSDKDNVSFMVVGPKLLFEDLIIELQRQGLSNQDNISYFKRHISRLDKSDSVLNSLCHPIIACLLRRLGDKVNQESCILLSQSILNTISEKGYFSLLLDWLAETVDNSSNNSYDSREKINEITHLIIADFVAKGYGINEIRRFSTDIPGVAITIGGIVESAPIEFEGIKQSDFPSRKEYYEAVSKLIKNRTIYQCVEVLKYYYYKTPQKAYVIVRLIGLKGQINDNIGDINIYSPKIKKYITNDHSITEIETLTEDRNYVNAAIPIDFVSIEQAKINAKAKLEEVLDILMLTYRTKTPIKIATNKFAVVSNGQEISMSLSNKGNDPQMASRDEMMRYLESLDLANVRKEDFKYIADKHNILEKRQGEMGRRLKNAAHWYAKASAIDKEEDVLLYSWFAIEGLLNVNSNTQMEMVDNSKNTNKLVVIQEFIESLICKSYFYSYFRDTYNYYLYLTNQRDNYFDLTQNVISEAGLNLNIGDQYRDNDFFKSVPVLMNSINDDIARDELADMHNFYQDINGLKEMGRQIKDDLLMIYRLRNMIVHNADISCVNITFYARVAKYFAQRVVSYVIDHMSGDKSIEEIVLGAKLDYQVFQENFDKELKSFKCNS